jgi:hypothetical protein
MVLSRSIGSSRPSDAKTDKVDGTVWWNCLAPEPAKDNGSKPATPKS